MTRPTTIPGIVSKSTPPSVLRNARYLVEQQLDHHDRHHDARNDEECEHGEARKTYIFPI